MREIAFAFGAIAVALGIVAAVVFGARDGDLFVPPPDAVAEEFGRELARARYDLALRQLSDQQRTQQTAEDLKARFAPLNASIGKLNHAEATEVWREDGRASAICELQGEPAAVALLVSLVRERGLWKIEKWEARRQ